MLLALHVQQERLEFTKVSVASLVQVPNEARRVAPPGVDEGI